MVRSGESSLGEGVRLRFIEPGKPVQNAFVESFNGRFRDPKSPLVECLNQHWFHSIGHARQEIALWRHHYNSERPHSALGYRSPSEFMATALPSPQQVQAPVLPAALEPDPESLSSIPVLGGLIVGKVNETARWNAFSASAGTRNVAITNKIRWTILVTGTASLRV